MGVPDERDVPARTIVAAEQAVSLDPCRCGCTTDPFPQDVCEREDEGRRCRSRVTWSLMYGHDRIAHMAESITRLAGIRHSCFIGQPGVEQPLGG